MKIIFATLLVLFLLSCNNDSSRSNPTASTVPSYEGKWTAQYTYSTLHLDYHYELYLNHDGTWSMFRTCIPDTAAYCNPADFNGTYSMASAGELKFNWNSRNMAGTTIENHGYYTYSITGNNLHLIHKNGNDFMYSGSIGFIWEYYK